MTGVQTCALPISKPKETSKRRIDASLSLLLEWFVKSRVFSQGMGEERKEYEEEEAAEEHKPEQPQDIVLKVDMDCQGCAKKVEKSLLRFEGVENVTANSRSKTVVVKSRTADPAKVCERVQRKTNRRVELISPLPPPPAEEGKKEHTSLPPTEEEKKEEPPTAITIILKVQMHCCTCTRFLEKKISKIEGVEFVETDLPNDQVIVRGVMDPAMLVENVQKKTRRAAVIVEEEKTSEGEEPYEDENKGNDDGGASELKKYDSQPPVQPCIDYVNPYPPAQVYPYSPMQVYRYPPAAQLLGDR